MYLTLKEHDEHPVTGQRERVLLNKPPRGRLGLSRWGLLFAAPFLAVGAWMAGIGVGIYPQQPGTTALPPWLVAAIGIIFFVAGLYIVAETLRSMAGRALAARARGLALWRFDRPGRTRSSTTRPGGPLTAAWRARAPSARSWPCCTCHSSWSQTPPSFR